MTSPIPEFKTIPLDKIAESKHNTRKHFDDAALQELAESIKQVGIITPLLLRPAVKPYHVSNGNLDGSDLRYVACKQLSGNRENLLETFSAGTAEENYFAALARVEELNAAEPDYEIAAGHRRYRAAIMAGRTDVPAIIREMDDKQFLEILTIENLQREDIHPLEEAAGYAELIEKNEYTVELLAEKVGKSASYIQKRLRLNDLIEPARQAYFEDKIQLSHALLLCRLDEAWQQKAFESMFREDWKSNEKYPISPKGLDSYIRDHILLSLSAAPWNKASDDLVPEAGSCNGCKKRTGANSLLFDDIKKGDHCLDSACFEKKREAHLVAVLKLAEAKGTPLTRVSSHYLQDREAQKHNCITPSSYHEIRKKDDRCDFRTKAIIVHGENVGKVFDICIHPDCQKHHGVGGAYFRPKTEKEELADRKKKLESKINFAYRKALVKRIAELVPASTPGLREFRYMAAYISGATSGNLSSDSKKAVAAALGEDFQALKERAVNMETAEAIRFAIACVASTGAGEYAWETATKELDAMARSYEINLRAVRDEVAGPLKAKFKKSEESRKKRLALEAKKEKPATEKKAQVDRKSAAAGERDDEDLDDEPEEVIDSEYDEIDDDDGGDE